MKIRMEHLASLISRENCQYRGEGNSCLVVKLASEDPVVLRFVKDDDSTKKSSTSQTIKNRLEDYTDVARNIMQPLFGEDLVHIPFIIPVSAEKVKVINDAVKHCRPDYRCHRYLKMANTYALVMPDVCSLPPALRLYPSQGPVICIEIKPKQGFFSHNAFYSSQTNKPPLCNYCMKQYFKIKKSCITNESSYCPMDLFSGCPSRMEHAVNSLVIYPQNNFRIFRNGECVYSEEQKCCLKDVLSDFFLQDCNDKEITSLSELIIPALLKPAKETELISDLSYDLPSQRKCANSSQCSSGDACSHTLPNGCILQKILKLQMLDNLEPKELLMHCANLGSADQDDSHKTHIGVLPRCQLPQYFSLQRQSSESSLHFASRKVWEFLLALTVKDASVLLTFQQLTKDNSLGKPPNEHIVTCGNDKNYLHFIAVIDLDMKTIDKVRKAYDKRCEIVESYKSA